MCVCVIEFRALGTKGFRIWSLSFTSGFRVVRCRSSFQDVEGYVWFLPGIVRA